jgi:NAD(P)-dependent dehydrogenase (short-subunit alcohol dehydrogenase family)
MLFSVSLAEKLEPKGVLSYSLYPGRISTNIAQYLTFEELRAAGELSVSVLLFGWGLKATLIRGLMN